MLQRVSLQGMGRCGSPMYGLGIDPFLPGGQELGTPSGGGSGITTGQVNTTQRRPSRDDEGTSTNQSDSDCPCEITEIVENKTVTIPVKSQKIICKPSTVRQGQVDCETIQAALRNLPGAGGNASTNNNTAGGPSNLLGLGSDIGISIDFLSLAIGGAVGYLAAKYI